MIELFFQDCVQVPVAVKTCKVDNEESIAEKFLEEACKYNSIIKTVKYIVNEC